jgi:hypothetical protein
MEESMGEDRDKSDQKPEEKREPGKPVGQAADETLEISQRETGATLRMRRTKRQNSFY